MQSSPPSAFDASFQGGNGSQRSFGSTHYVQFYENEAFLHEVASDFLSAGLQAHDQLVVLATEAHRSEIFAQMRARRWDVDAILRAGQLTIIDASSALEQALRDDSVGVDGVPNELSELVRRHRAIAPHQRVRLYGEVAGLLLKHDRPSLCRALEEGCNRLSLEHPLTFLCAYHVDPLAPRRAEALVQQICGLHSHVLPSEHCVMQSRLEERLRHLFLLEQRVQVQASELAESQRNEAALRNSLAFRDAKAADTGEVVRKTLVALHGEIEALESMSRQVEDREVHARVDECQRLTCMLENLLVKVEPKR